MNFLVVTVSGAVDGFDNGGLDGIDFDFFAELGDVLVERTTVGEVVHAPGVIVELIAGDDLEAVLREDGLPLGEVGGDFDCVLMEDDSATRMVSRQSGECKNFVRTGWVDLIPNIF